MTTAATIDSNVTELAWAEETSFKTLPGTPIWRPAEPNQYGDLGGSITTVAREPIASDRQRRKPVIVDLDATVDYETDVTQNNIADQLQGYLFANYRKKIENTSVTAVDGTAHTLTLTNTSSAIRVGDLILGSGFTNAGNNVLSRVTALTSTTAITVSTGLTTEASPPAAHRVVVVGFQFAAGDALITNGGTAYPTLTATVKDLTQLGIVPGEWVYIGDGTNALFSFATAANNGFARVRSVTATVMTFDKTYTTMVTSSGDGSKTIRIYLGRVLKNETGSSIVRRTYNFERKLGAPDAAAPTLIQSEYVIGAVASELELKVPKAAKITANLKYVGADSEQRLAATGIKSGTRATLTALDAFNSTSDVSKLKLATSSTTDACPSALFDYLSEVDISINNNVKGNKAIATLGAFEAATGSFDVSAKVQAYFAVVSATSTVRAGTSLSLDMHLVKNNAGISIDLPQLVASKALNSVKRNEPIEVPLESNASSGLEIDSTMNHTMLMVFFDYLPSVADA